MCCGDVSCNAFAIKLKDVLNHYTDDDIGCNINADGGYKKDGNSEFDTSLDRNDNHDSNNSNDNNK